MFSMLVPPLASADIYRWVDDGGTAHFTDDVSNIPAAYRGKATTIVREPPEAATPPAPSGGGTGAPAPEAQPSTGNAERDAAGEIDALASEIEQLKAKIAAKETLIKKVDDRRNLILNPMRARVIDPSDLELYDKYRAELPGDLQRLQELENRLQSFK